MNKNTTIGIVLIGLIFIVFSIYNTRQAREQAEYKRVQDSIANVRAWEYAQEIAAKRADSIARLSMDSTGAFRQEPASQPQYANTYSNEYLEQSHNAAEEFFILQNDKIRVDFTTRGAQPYSVLVKNYFTSDSTDLFLMKEKASNFGVQLFTSQMINTKDFTFQATSHNDTSLVMRLFFSDDAYLEYDYTLLQGSYMVDFDFRLVGMDRIIPRNATNLDFIWNMDVPRLEKGYDNEKNYSTIDFKYPGEKSSENLGLRKSEGEKDITTKFQWFAFQQQFFSAIFLAENNFSSGKLAYKFYDETNPDKKLMACSADAQVQFDRGNNVTIPFKFYFGPNHFKTLKSYDYSFEKIVPLGGWGVGWINRIIIIPVFDLLSRFIKSYGLIILLMTILLKLVISPLTIKSYMSSAKMNVLKPEVDKINAKYPKQEDAMKKQQEVMALYKKAGVNMMGGCLPMLLQFPVLWAMFRFFPASFELRQQGFLWASDLSTYDSIWDMPFRIPLFGDHLSLFAILVGISMFVYSKMTSKQMEGNPQMAGMKLMTLYFMPVMMLFICNNLSSALSYYYLLSNLFMMAQTWVIRKYFVDEEKILAKIRMKSSKNEAKPKSKFQQRLEAMQKAQQEAMRQQQQGKRK